MSVECSVCEWDAQAGHAPDCKFNPIHDLRAENVRLRTEVEQVELINFRRVEENTRLRKALTMIRNAVDITRDQVTEGWIIGVADDALKLG